MGAVTLDHYLRETGQSDDDFAALSGIQRRTINRIRNQDGCNAGTALAIIRASARKPTATGGIVTLEDLVVDDGDGAAA